MASQSPQVEILRQKIADLTVKERELEADLKALLQGIFDLEKNRPTTFLAGKLRDRKIRKATQVLNEGKKTLTVMKSNLTALEVELEIALDQ